MFLELAGLGNFEKSLFFRPLFFTTFPVFSIGDLIFCQKKILLSWAWFCQNKTFKFDLLTLLKTLTHSSVLPVKF